MPFSVLDQNFFQYVLDPVFLVTFGLTAGTFLPLLYSVWRTWEDNGHKSDNFAHLNETAREGRARVRRRREARRAGRLTS